MPAIKVTQKKVESLVKKPHAKQIDYRDILTAGLVLRIGPRGAVWNYLRRVDQRLHRVKLGDWPTMKIKAARDAVADLEQAIADGKNPKAEQARRQAEKHIKRKQDKELLVKNVISGWTALHYPTLAKRTRRDYRAPVSEFSESFAGREITTIKRGELIRHLDKIKARSSAQANRAAVIIRQLFSYAVDRHDLQHNPAANLKSPAKATRRKRTLDRAEIGIIWRACELAGYPYGHALRLALCTGQRIGEIGGMRWSDIEDEYWCNAENKTDQRIDIYLGSHASRIIKDCPRISKYVLSATGHGPIRSDTWSGAMARYIRPRVELAARELKHDTEIKHWTAHDLRRTVRSGLTGWAGVSPDTAERVLNHSIGGIRKVYDHADYKPHVAEALKAWDVELKRILQGRGAKFVQLREAVA